MGGGYAVICNGFVLWLHEEKQKHLDGMLDYKWFCFDGEPRIMYISNDKGSDPRTDFFDMEFNFLDVHMRDPNSDVIPSKPACFDKMRELDRKLSKDIPHVRVDFYYVNGRIYFGEMTFCTNGGFVLVKPDEWNRCMGEWIKFPE